MNGNKPLLWWLLGGIVAPLLVGTLSHLFSACAQHGERLSILESKNHEVSRRLQEIERKIDELLRRRKEP